MELRELWLSLHVLGAIIAFGFGFVAPIFGSMTAKEPQHANWYLRSGKRASNYVLVPAALSMAVTGLLLVNEFGDFRLFEQLWLASSVVIYVIALLTVFLVQRPALDKLIMLTAEPPGPEGPSPEIPALADRLKFVGIGLGVAIIVIVFLMVSKPVL